MRPQRRLLIVEDNPSDVMLLRRAVREQDPGVEIRVIEDGEAAIDFLEKCRGDQTPHLVVIDINLPKRDGIEVLRKCRFSPGLAQTKTMIFTSSDEPSDHSRSSMLGADAYLRKPHRIDDFTGIVKVMCDLMDSAARSGGEVLPNSA